MSLLFRTLFVVSFISFLATIFLGDPAIWIAGYGIAAMVFGILSFVPLETAWPFVHEDEFHKVRRENMLLREALRDANAELLKHRQLITGLRTGQSEITEAFERAINGTGKMGS